MTSTASTSGRASDPVGDPGRERLDEVQGLALDEGHTSAGDLGVVDGVGQVVAGTGRGQVDRHDDVHEEGLAVTLLGSSTPWKPLAAMPFRMIWSVTCPP